MWRPPWISRVRTTWRWPCAEAGTTRHGAPKDADPTGGAAGFRHAAFNITAMATWQDPALDPQYVGWARETAAAIEPWSIRGGYINYMQADEPIERVRAAFGPEPFERLRELKARYDPDQRPAPQPEHPAALAPPGAGADTPASCRGR